MDYINTDICYEELMKVLSKQAESPEEIKLLRDIQIGHDAMLSSCQLIIEKSKNAIFRLYRRKMNGTGETISPAYKLGIMTALNELGIRFLVKDEYCLEEKMALVEKHEKRVAAMRKILNEEVG